MMRLCTTTVAAGKCSERRRVAKLLSIFQPRKYRLPCSTHLRAFHIPPPPLRPSHMSSLAFLPAPRYTSTHYANMRYQFDGDPRLFVSPILIARPVDRLIPRVRVSFSVPKFDVGIGSSVFNARFSHRCESLARIRHVAPRTCKCIE